ncbi:MAG: hypothetical protein ACKVQC_05555 [Elusimicrobiota bacterium]
MKVKRFYRKSISLALTLVYLSTQVVWAAKVETDFWAQRRSKIETQNEEKKPVQLAALPNSFNSQFNSKNILKELPAIGHNLTVTPKWSNSKRNQNKNISPKLRDLVDAVPLNVATIQEVYSTFETQHKEGVALIQDVHMNMEAQKNIVSVIQAFVDQQKISTIGVEGAFEKFDFKPFRVYPNLDIRKSIAGDFLVKNLLAAPSYVGITSEIELPQMIGIDDPDHYSKNVEALLNARQTKEKATKELDRIKKTLTDEKKKGLSKELNNFDQLRISYHKGNVGLGAYLKRLKDFPTSANPSSPNVSIGDLDLTTEQFLEAYQMESNLDFKRVESERTIVIEKLTKTLSEKEIAELMQKSLAYRLGKIDFGIYYQDLKDLCEKKGVPLRQAPHFEDYIRYVLLSDGIKADRLFESVNQLEKQIVRNLAKSSKELELMNMSNHISLTEKLIDFSLTPNEWLEYKGFPTTLFSGGARGGILTPFEKFYEEADIRSAKMLENLNSKSQSPNNKQFPKFKNKNEIKNLNFDAWDLKFPKPTVLVVGGFHTQEIKELLKKQKTPYVVISPKLTKIDEGSGSAYLSVFSREKTPLDRLFAGEKLFLNSDHLALGTGAPKTLLSEKLAAAAIKVINTQEQETVEGPSGSEYRVVLDPNKKIRGLRLGEQEELVVQETRFSALKRASIFRYPVLFLKSLIQIPARIINVLSHPLTAPITETLMLWAAVSYLSDPTGLSSIAAFFIILVFSLIHGDLWDFANYQNQKFEVPEFLSRFFQRFVGGFLLILPFFLTSGWNAVIWSAGVHLFWNGIYYFREGILQTKFGQIGIVAWVLERMLPLAIVDRKKVTEALAIFFKNYAPHSQEFRINLNPYFQIPWGRKLTRTEIQQGIESGVIVSSIKFPGELSYRTDSSDKDIPLRGSQLQKAIPFNAKSVDQAFLLVDQLPLNWFERVTVNVNSNIGAGRKLKREEIIWAVNHGILEMNPNRNGFCYVNFLSEANIPTDKAERDRLSFELLSGYPEEGLTVFTNSWDLPEGMQLLSKQQIVLGLSQGIMRVSKENGIENPMIRWAPGKTIKDLQRFIELLPTPEENEMTAKLLRITSWFVSTNNDSDNNEPGTLARRIEQSDWNSVEILFEKIKLVLEDPEKSKQSMRDVAQVILTWTSLSADTKGLLIGSLWKEMEWLLEEEGRDILLKISQENEEIYNKAREAIRADSLHRQQWLRKFFQVFHHSFYLYLRNNGKKTILLGQIRRYVSFFWKNVYNRINHVAPMYTNRKGGFISSCDWEEVVVIEDEVDMDLRLIGVHEAQHHFDFKLLRGEIDSQDREYLAYLRTAIEVGKLLENRPPDPLSLLGQIFAGTEILNYYLAHESEDEAHIQGTKRVLVDFSRELNFATGSDVLAALTTIPPQEISKTARKLMDDFYRSHGKVPNYLDIDLFNLPPVFVAAPDGSWTDGRTDKFVKSEQYRPQLMDALKNRQTNPFTSSINNTGGISFIVKALFFELPYLILKMFIPSLKSASIYAKWSSRYNRFAAPLIENGIVLSVQSYLMSDGMNALSAGLWVWGVFAALHFFEWIIALAVWALSGKESRLDRGPPLPLNFGFSLVIAGFSIFLLSVIPVTSVLSAPFIIYAFLSTLGHMGVNNATSNSGPSLKTRSKATDTVVKKESEKNISLSQGVDWLADIGAALLTKNVSKLVDIKPLGLGGIGQTENNSEAATIAQLNEWVNKPEFYELMVQGLKNRLSQSSIPELSTDELEYFVDLLIVMVLEKQGKGGKIQKEFSALNVGNNNLFLFKGATTGQERRLRSMGIMMILRQMQEKSQNQFVVDTAAREEIEMIKNMMERFGALTGKMNILVNDDEFRSDKANIQALNNIYDNPSLIVLPQDMKPDTKDNKVKAFEELVAPLASLNVSSLAQFLRVVLVAA